MTTASIFKQLSSARTETQKLLGYINEALSALEGSTMTINTPGNEANHSVDHDYNQQSTCLDYGSAASHQSRSKATLGFDQES